MFQATTAATATTSSPSPTGTLARQPTVSPYTFAGCWTEGTGARALGADTYASINNMTLENCAAFCDGYRYFGTEYAGECFCGNTLHPTSTEAALEDCSMTCTGNPYQYCGGPNRLELYEAAGAEAPPAPSQPATVGAWTFHGCMTEATGARALASEALAADSLTLEGCAAFCDGYRYFGAEFGRECYCGDAFGEGSAEAPAADCSMPCAGDGGQLCGAGNRLSVYVAA